MSMSNLVNSLVCAALVTVGIPLLAYAAPPVPQGLEGPLNRLLQAGNHWLTNPSPAEMAEAQHAFSAAASELASRIDPDTAQKMRAAEGESIEAKLATIILDRNLRPEIYDEIERTYFIRVAKPTSRAPTAPPVLPQHATENYRLAWEFFLLRPAGGLAFKSDLRAMEALAQVNNPASILALLHCYQLTTRQGIPSRRVDTQQSWLFNALSRFQNRAGLKALLECTSLSQNQQSHEGASKSHWDAERALREVLSGKYGNRERWQEVVAALPKSLLPMDQAQLLENAIRRQQ
jgi:hypothetical protein